MSQQTIALIALAVYFLATAVFAALACWGSRKDGAFCLIGGKFLANPWHGLNAFQKLLKIVFAGFPVALYLITISWQYVAMIAIVIFLFGQLTGCAVNVVVMPDATIQYGSAIDQHVDQSQVKQGQ